MSVDRIFHYTTIESLALILSTGKLRFNRLDRVDDLREAQTHVGIDFGKYFFVSCWTMEKQESIPQWHMYSSEMQGVRIELPANPFRQVPLKPNPEWTGIEVQDGLSGPLSLDEMIGTTHFVAPFFHPADNFAGTVEYVQDVEARYASAIKVFRGEESGVSINAFPKLPRLKSVEWQFQKEFRFHLFAFPVPTTVDASKSIFERIGEHSSQGFLNNVDPGISGPLTAAIRLVAAEAADLPNAPFGRYAVRRQIPEPDRLIFSKSPLTMKSSLSRGA